MWFVACGSSKGSENVCLWGFRPGKRQIPLSWFSHDAAHRRSHLRLWSFNDTDDTAISCETLFMLNECAGHPDNQVTSTGLKALPTLKYPQNYPDVSITRFSFNVYLHIDLETVSS